MQTPAEIIYDILNVPATTTEYTNYKKKPTIKIEGQHNTWFQRPGGIGLRIRNVNEDPVFAYNGARIINDGAVELRIAEKTNAKRNSLYDDVEALFEASTYDITFTITSHPDARTLYVTLLRVSILK
jgi:hypothetical protein